MHTVYDAVGRWVWSGETHDLAVIVAEVGAGAVAVDGAHGPDTQWDGDAVVPVPPAETAPDSIPRLRFWLYLATLGVSRAAVLAAIDGFEAAEALSAAEAEIARLKVTDATTYHRTDPLLTLLGDALSIASTQADVDAHFAAALAMEMP